MKIHICLWLLTSVSAWANPHLDLIKDQEWKGECRKNTNEAGQELRNQPIKRLQSSYSLVDGELIWWVKTFNDDKCAQIHDGNKFSFKCEFTAKDEYAACTQTTLAHTSDGRVWIPEPSVDHAGYPIVSKMKVKAQAVKGKVKLTTTSDDDDPSSEILSISI